MKQTKPTIIELDMGNLEDLLRRVDANELHAEDGKAIRALVQSYIHLTELLKDKNTSIARLRKMLFGAKTEKTAAVVGSGMDTQTPSSPETDTATDPSPQSPESSPEAGSAATAENDSKVPPQGHGRNGADDYTGAEKIRCRTRRSSRAILARSAKRARSTIPAPACWCGWWASRPCGPRSTISRSCVAICAAWSSPPTAAGRGARRSTTPTVGQHDCPAEIRDRDAFQPTETLQENLGIPLPASTQWDIVEAQAERAEPVFEDWFGKRPKATWCITTTRRSRSWR